MSALLGLALMLMPLQADETYTCVNIRPSLLLNNLVRKPVFMERKVSLRPGDSDLVKVSITADDVARTLRFRGNPTDVATAVAFAKAIDQPRMRVLTKIRIESLIDAVDTEVIATMKGNIPLEVNEPESRVKLSVVARPNEDGSFTVFVGKPGANSQMGAVKRVAANESFRFLYAKDSVRLLDVDETPTGDFAIVTLTVAPVIPVPTPAG